MIQISEDVQMGGQLSVIERFFPPAGFLDNTHVASTAAIDASKIKANRCVTQELVGPATLCSALTKSIYSAQGPGTLLAWAAWIEVTGTAGDKVVTVDLKKSTGGGAWTTVLSAPITFAAAAAVRTLVTGTISVPAYVAGDLFQAVVTVSGSTGAYAQGLSVQLRADESYA